jgi:3-isopropylmalate/(R)-2-methylmalate dehydratase small subunit
MLKGKAWKFGDNVDTDVIIPARYLNTTDPQELAKHCMEDADPEFPKKVKPGDIIVAGRNFGCGSSREHAPIAIKACGISCVIAESFARIFYRNAFNTGLLIIECPEAAKEIETGDELEVDLDGGKIINLTKNKTYAFKPIPPFMRQILEDGGLIPHIMKKYKASCEIPSS